MICLGLAFSLQRSSQKSFDLLKDLRGSYQSYGEFEVLRSEMDSLKNAG